MHIKRLSETQNVAILQVAKRRELKLTLLPAFYEVKNNPSICKSPELSTSLMPS